MPRRYEIYLVAAVAVSLLFLNAIFTLGVIAAYGIYLIFSLRLYSKFRWSLKPTEAEPTQAEDTEPTIITLVAKAPHEILGVKEDAGTSTIFYSFQKLAKSEQQDNLRLTKKGRRLQAAKKTLLSRRRHCG